MAYGSNPSTTLSIPGDPDPQDDRRQKVERTLWKWNLAMAILHGVQAVIALGASLGVTRLKNFKIPMTTAFTDWSKGYPVPAIQIRDNMPFVAVTSGFAFMSSAAHIIVLICFTRYLADLRRGYNVFRWYEYAASSSLMIALIAQLFGVYDVTTLVAIMGCNAAMNMFGLFHETINAGRKPSEVDWSSFTFGCIVGAIPWAIIFANIGGNSALSNIPNFVWALLFVYLGFFNIFPLNMVLQYKQVGWWSDTAHGFPGGGYLFGERMYQVQSLVSKSLLLWLVVGGANQPNSASASA